MSEAPMRSIVVTGGSKGIGRAICRAFAGPDCRIFFNYSKDSQAAQETESLVASAGGKATGIQCDVVNTEDVDRFFKTVLDETGRVDVLVNNAGITRDGLLVRMKEKDWDDVMQINLKGVFNCSKAAAKPMIKQRSGRIICMTSVVGAAGNQGQANYSASKAGIIGFTKSLAKELAPKQITANAVAPGYIETDMTASMNEKSREAMISQIPLGRTGTPEDVAGVVVFLASEAASYITGQVIHISGGMYM